MRYNPYAFEDWMTRVDDDLYNASGFGYGDFADQPFYEWFQAGVSFETAARRVLRAEGMIN